MYVCAYAHYVEMDVQGMKKKKKKGKITDQKGRKEKRVTDFFLD